MQNPTIPAKGNGAKLNSKSEADAVAKISLEFHNFVEDMEDLIKASTSLTGEDLKAAKEKINELIAAGKKSSEVARIRMRDRAQNTAAVTNAYVHNQPWKAIGITVVCGLVLGYLLPRRT